MPKIYELPAQTGAEPDLMRGGPVTRAPFREQQQPPGSDDPIRMLTNQESMELNNVTRWFDSQTAILDQQQLDPDKHRAAYARLQSQATTQRTEVRAKHVTNAQQIKNMQKLVESGILAPEQMQATMLVMVGVPVEHVRATFAQQKKQKPMAQLRDLRFQADRIQAFRGRFVDHRKDIFGKGLWRAHPDTGKKTDIPANKDERQAYVDAETQLYIIQTRMAELFEDLSPLEKLSEAGRRAVERFGMEKERLGEGRVPMPTGRWGGVPGRVQPFSGIQVSEPAPEEQPTATELKKQKTRKAYKQGKRLGYWE